MTLHVPFSAENGKGRRPLIPPPFRKVGKQVLIITCQVKNDPCRRREPTAGPTF